MKKKLLMKYESFSNGERFDQKWVNQLKNDPRRIMIGSSIWESFSTDMIT